MKVLIDTSGFLISSAIRNDARQELRLLALAPLRGELLLRRQVLEDQDGTERQRVVPPDGVGRDLEPEPAQGELQVGACDGAARAKRVIEHVAERRGQHA